MVKRIGGLRRKSRHKLKKNIRERGKLSLSKFFQTFKIGEKAILKANPTIQKALPNPRFHGRIGEVTKKQGSCYYIKIKDHNKTKTIITHPIHLKKCQK